MATRPFKSLLHWLIASRKRKSDGFTLAELLVGMFIASIVSSGLLYLVVQLLETNQRETSQTQTQQEVQSALGYISSELREAVYVYGGDCLKGKGTTAIPDTFCPGVVNHIFTNSANSTPILAFWKLDNLPLFVKQQCQLPTPPAEVSASICTAGRTYTLVVYFLTKNQVNDPTWSGKARITRYALTQFKGNTLTQNTPYYVTPDQIGVEFRFWPYRQTPGGVLVSLQTAPAQPDTSVDTLVDFVDDTTIPNADNNVTCPTPSPTPSPPEYTLTPEVTTAPFVGVRSFYACVRNIKKENISNQDVLLFLRGNAAGKPGISNNKFRPFLKTHVLNRGVDGKEPKIK